MVSIDEETIPPESLVFHITGRVTFGHDAQELEAKLDEAVARRPKKLVLDLANVSYIDSTAVGIIMLLATKLAQVGGKLHIAGALGVVAQTLTFSHAETVIPMHASVEAALSA